MIGSRLLTGAGYTLKVPAIDLAEVGAGGGSHVWIDAGGALQVGPRERRRRRPGRSATTTAATSRPSPTPTCVLGYINPAHLVGGALKLNADKARAVFADKIAEPLGMPLERGGLRRAPDRRLQHDPRHQGGLDRARPRSARVRAVRLRRQRPAVRLPAWRRALGITPRGRAAVAPGLFSSFGLLYADVEHHYARTFRRLLRAGRPRRDRRAPGTRWRGRRRRSSPPRASPARARGCALGGAALQGPELRADRAGARRADRCRHGRRISRRPSAQSTSGPTATAPAPTSRSSWSSIQVVGQGLREGGGVPERVVPSRAGAAPRSRRAAPISATEHGWLETPVLSRADLATGRSRAADRRGIRRDLRRAARRHAPSSTRGGNIVITL